MTQKTGVTSCSADEMTKNGDEGARHLSSNQYIHHYDEGPAEKLDSLLGQYLSKEVGEANLWCNRIAKVNSKAGQIFHHAETVEYLKALRECRPHFNVDQFFSIKFCMEKLHSVNGAVSEFTYYTQVN